MRQLYVAHNKIILIDATFKTNVFNMPLVLIAGIDNESKTLLLAFGLIQTETSTSIGWILSQLLEANNYTYPVVLVSDECKSIDKAVKRVLGKKTEHLHCSWHKQQNIIKHTAYLAKDGDLKKAPSKFRMLAFIES